MPDALDGPAMPYLLMADLQLSMTALAVVTCVVITLADFGWEVRPVAFAAGVVLMALLMVLLGFVSAPLFPRSASGSSRPPCCWP